ncbi:MAG: hypothetical protein DHS20C15_22390 [Planctomycetota bacterium]|nr:MAG: hypothetical protein DHS20C15_22390 [Planctomycetota bacterium]
MSDTQPAIHEFTADGVLLTVEGDSKVEILECMVNHAVSAKLLPKARKELVLQLLTEREERGSTGVGMGVAVPHARIKGLKKALAVMARSAEGVDFRAVDGEPVYALIMLVSPENQADTHLATLRWLSQHARDPDFVSFIRQARSPEALLEVLLERAP